MMIYSPVDKDIYDSIVSEFELSNSNIEKMKELIENLIKSRIDICKLFKMQKFKNETLDANNKELIKCINTNKSSIKEYEKGKVEIKGKIKVNKENIKFIKSHINKLEDELNKEKQEGRKLREALQIFLSREKFKFIKKLIVRKYKRVYLNYSNELSIKIEIKQCNERKKKIREEKLVFNNNIDKYNRKIIIHKIALSEIRKNTINMQKQINFFIIKIQNLMNYKKLEMQFRIEAHKYETID